MKLLLLVTIIICLHHILVQCQDQEPKDEVEIIPTALEKERKKIKLFWALMFEVCRTFCVWKTFCKSFCEIFNPEKDPDFGINFGLLTGHSARLVSSEKTIWLHTMESRICENDAACIEKCQSMQEEDYNEDPWQENERPANVLRALYQLSKSYFAQCAKINGKPATVVDSFTVEEFCREITSAGREFTGQCLNLLA